MKIFLDHNSTTPILPLAFDSMKPYFTDLFYNPGGIQTICQDINSEIEKSRDILESLISHKKGRLIFTSSATEANNFIISQNYFTEILTTGIEHPSIIESSILYHKNEVIFLSLKSDGLIELENLESNLRTLSNSNRRILVSIQYANQVIHTIQPIESISKLCRKYGAYLHVDATQAFGKIPLIDYDIDFITVSAHKCYGPKGIAGLWISDDFDFNLLTPILAGGHQEFNKRAGTHNVAGIIGFRTAAEYMCTHYEEHRVKIETMSKRFYKGFVEQVSDCVLNGNLTNRLPGGFHFSVPGADMRSILISLPDLIISTGMACSSSESDPVLKALGKMDSTRNSFRMQIGFENTEQEMDTAVELLSNAIIKSRSFWGNI